MARKSRPRLPSLIDEFGSPFDTELPLSFLVQFPKCFTKTTQEMKPEILQKLTDKSLIYIFYNYEGKGVQQEAAKLLYKKEWIYNYEECLWFYKLNFNEPTSFQFFNIKKWCLQQYQYEVRKDKFAKAEDFDVCYKISEDNGVASPTLGTPVSSTT